MKTSNGDAKHFSFLEDVALEDVVGLKQGAFHRLASTTCQVIL